MEMDRLAAELAGEAASVEFPSRSAGVASEVAAGLLALAAILAGHGSHICTERSHEYYST